MAKKFPADKFRELLVYAQSQRGLSKSEAVQFLRSESDDSKQRLYDEMKSYQAREVVLSGVSFAHVAEALNQPKVNKPVSEPLTPSPARSVVKEKTSPSSKPRKVTYSFKIDPSVLTRLRHLAETEERDVSDLIRLAINNYLKMKMFT